MPDEPTDDALMADLEEHGQQHIARWLQNLSAEKRRRLAEQLARVNFERLADFRELIATPPTDISFGDVRPAPVERLPLDAGQVRAEKDIRRAGCAAFEADRVAAVTVAGGQGTRLGYDHPKGMYPISPIRGKSLFQLFAEQILAARRRYGCTMPWLIMTGPTNDDETREFFAENDYFGLGRPSVHFFVQGWNPIVDEEGRLLLAEEDELLVGPDGHGGTFDALARNGMLQMLREGGYDLISYFQVDNPLVTVADPRYVGYHLARDAEFSCKVIPKRDPDEGLGIAVVQGGQPAVVEYIDVPPDIAAQRGPDGHLLYRFGSIAIHIINVSFAERVAHEPKGLPWHVAQKQYEVLEPESGRKVESEPGGCYKFERFIFDSLQFADSAAFVEVRRDTEFAPVKNAEGQDSPQSCRRLMQRMWMEWVKKAGGIADLPSLEGLCEPMIEISPLFASSAEELAEKVGSAWEPSFPLVLEPSD